MARRARAVPKHPPARRRALSPRKRARSALGPALSPIVPGSVPQGAETTAIPRVDRPHSQAVCRGCGRILELALTLEELRTLAGLADRAPDGWRVDGLSFTLMGACRRCREGPRS